MNIETLLIHDYLQIKIKNIRKLILQALEQERKNVLMRRIMDDKEYELDKSTRSLSTKGGGDNTNNMTASVSGQNIHNIRQCVRDDKQT